jgi:hypothetical protein
MSRGNKSSAVFMELKTWIPAFAGMTGNAGTVMTGYSLFQNGSLSSAKLLFPMNFAACCKSG